MPIPKPGDKEDKKKFMQRCMSDEVMNKEYPDQAQRSAICYKQCEGLEDETVGTDQKCTAVNIEVTKMNEDKHVAHLKNPDKFDSFRHTMGGTVHSMAADGKVKKVAVPSDVKIKMGHPKSAKNSKLFVPQSLHFPAGKYTADQAKKFASDHKLKMHSFSPARKATEQVDTVAEQETSDKSWASVDKAKLPASCFLWVEDPEKKSTWHLPYREGAGTISAETGMYSSAGPVNLGAVRAIMAALGGARSGKAMNVPAEIKTKAENLAKKYKIGKYAEKQEQLEQAFMSLRELLDGAVEDQLPDYFLVDFSNKEAILRKSIEISVSPVATSTVPAEDECYIIGYTITRDGVVFDGQPEKVRRVVTYQ